MIFVTVGHQMPFDRLVRAMDAWAEQAGRSDCFAQIGDGAYAPRRFPSARFLAPQQFRDHMANARAIVAHAGTGTILSALQLGKPILVLPRRSDLGETRNDHQVATAKHFAAAGHVLAAYDEGALVARMADLEQQRPGPLLGGSASPELLAAIRTFLRV